MAKERTRVGIVMRMMDVCLSGARKEKVRYVRIVGSRTQDKKRKEKKREECGASR